MISRRTALTILTASAPLLAIDMRESAGKFKAKTIDGELFNNDLIAGKVTLIQFWGTWCQYCKSDEPAVNGIAEEFGAKGLIVLAVDVGESKR